MRIACSDKHAMVVTNTGAVYTWGENDFSQLGYNTPKQGNGVNFSVTPRKVENLSKTFVIDVACGNYHSLALTNDKNVFIWGANKFNQLGFDNHSYPLITNPKKVILHEYMNSANQEFFNQIYARGDYTVLVAKSKNVYVTDKSTQGQFLPLFGKTPGNFHYKKLDTNVYTANEYILFMDSIRSIYRYEVGNKQTVS